MIDVIVNEFGGLTLAYDGDVLDGCVSVTIDVATGHINPEFYIILENKPQLSPLAPSILKMLHDGMKGSLVKMNGWSLAKASDIGVRLLNVPAESPAQSE